MHNPALEPSSTPPVEPGADISPESLPTSPVKVIREIGGPSGPEPTRYGDWEKKGRCIDF